MELLIIKYGRTFNTGDYTSERYDVEAAVEPGDNPINCTASLKALVLDMFRAKAGYVAGLPTTVPQDDVRTTKRHA